MKNKKALMGFMFTIIFIFLSMPLLCASDAVREWENRLQKAASPSERLKCLGALVELCMQEDPQKALEYGYRALRTLNDAPDDKTKVRVLLGMCGASGSLGNYRDALDMGRQAETLAAQINDKNGLAMANGYIANIYFYYSDFHKALKHALTARKMSEALGYEGGIARALVSIARVYLKLGEYEKALANYREALKISEKLAIRGSAAEILEHMANVYWYSRQYQKALEYYSRALKIMNELKSETGIADIMANIACVYSEIGKHTEALQSDREALKIYQKIGNKGRIAHLFGSIGRDYKNLEDYPRALEYLDKSLKMAEELERKDLIKELYNIYTPIYEARGDYKKALLYHRKFKETSDDILNENRNREITHLQVLYEVEKTEKENQLLKKNNHIQKLELDRQKLMRNSFALVSILVIITALLTYNRYRTRKKTERVLRASEQKLMKMNAAKDRLFTIIAHDLGSPLNSLLLSASHLKNHFQSLDNQDLEEFIHNMYKQTRDMSDLLENLLQWAMVRIGKIEHNPEILDMHLLTGETLEQIKYSAQKKQIRLSSHIMENTFARADKNMMKAVMRNLLSNAVKYTQPGGKVGVTSKDTGSRIEITVVDNGVGMDKEKAERLFKEEFHESTRGTANEKGTGLGLVLCKEFVEKHDGEIWVQSQPDQGSRFSFTIPRGE